MASGELPEGWDLAPIASRCTRTETVSPARQPRSTFEYIDVSAISNESWSITSSAAYQGSQAPSRARKLVREGDVIFATVRPTLKRVALIPGSRDGQVASTAFCVLRSVPKKLNNRFLYYLLLTEDFTARMENIQRGASYPAVSDRDVMEQEIPLPPLSEQHSIAGVLSKLQGAVEAQDRIIATLKELKAATLAKLFREGLRGEPLKETEIGEIPESWEVARLGECCDVLTSSIAHSDFERFPSTNNQDSVLVHGLKVSDMNSPGNEIEIQHSSLEKRLSTALAEKKCLPANSIVFPKRGAAIATNKKRITTTWTVLDPNVIAIRPRSSLDTGFLYNWFLQFDLQSITEPGATPQLNKKNLLPLALPVPPSKEEQVQIARILDTIERALGRARNRHGLGAAAFSSMLHLLMTGEVRVTPLMKEAAS